MADQKNYSYSTKKLPKSTHEITLSVVWPHIEKSKEQAIAELAKKINVPGFRVGQVPANVASKHLHLEDVLQKTVSIMLPEIYAEILKTEKLNPATSPKVELLEAKEGSDWKLTIEVPLQPEVKLKNYKEEITKLKKLHKPKKETSEAATEEPPTSSKSEKKPESEKVKKDSHSHHDHEMSISEVFEVLLKEVECEVSPILVEESVNRRLSQLIDEVRRVGMTLESYMQSKNLTPESLRESVAKESEDMYRLEYILAAIADSEGINVDQKDIDAIIGEAKTEKEKQSAIQNMSWYNAILRKQKTIDFLNSL